MKLLVSALLALLAASSSDGFATRTAFVTPSSASQRTGSTELYISSWGSQGPPSRWKKPEEPDPAEKIQAYLKAPEPVAARDNLDGSVLVSGWVKSTERTDQEVFDFLNAEESAFGFSKIVAFVDDEKFAKKRLIGRHARYTGLLDKLDFIQATESGALPTVEQLEGVKSWVANVGSDLSAVASIGELVKNSGVENVSILLTDASELEVTASLDAVKALEADGKSFTVIAVGKITETAEGAHPYAIHDFGTEGGAVPSNATFSRGESLRLVTECLGLECGKNKALAFTEVHDVNATETKLVRGLREAGYTRPQEIDHMMTKGVEAYIKACEEYKTKKPERTEEEDWMLREEEKLKKAQEEALDRQDKEREDKKKKEIDNIAREWAKRDFFRRSMAGEVADMTEDEYIESVWDRALFEGDLKWRILNGYTTDEKQELEDFKSKQEKKKQNMLEKAKASLAELLDEEDDAVPAGKDEEKKED